MDSLIIGIPYDLDLTRVSLGIIMYLAFFCFADKKNWKPSSAEAKPWAKIMVSLVPLMEGLNHFVD